MSVLLIKNGTVITAKEVFPSDILVEGEKISRVEKQISPKQLGLSEAQMIDAKGCYVIPGGIDPHVHLELPLKTTVSSDDFESGSAAALYGGTTTLLDFANQVPGQSLLRAVDSWHQKAQGKCYCDYGFHATITDFHEKTKEEIQQCFEVHGITSFKTFMAYKGSLMIRDQEMIQIMEHVNVRGGIVLVHAENGEMIEHLVQQFRMAESVSPRYHALSHPPLAEAEAVGRALDLAAFTNCPLYIVHLSSAEGLRRAKHVLKTQIKGPPVFLETCIQYLLLDDSVYESRNFSESARFVCSPPLRKIEGIPHLWRGLTHGSIQVVATDHCPFTLKQRLAGERDFFKIPNGVPGVEHRIELLFSEGVLQKKISFNQWVTMTSTAAAKIFGIYPKKGKIQPGSDADLVVFDPLAKHTISAKTHHMKCDYSLYEGRPVTGKCRTVILRGQVAVDQGKMLLPKGYGQYLKRAGFLKKTNS